MAHLHLPEQHSTDDLMLAGQIAEAFESEDLYVVWTRADGPGAVPSVQALLRDAPPHPLAGFVRALLTAFADARRARKRARTKPAFAAFAGPVTRVSGTRAGSRAVRTV